ncbi:MAG: hypothetical protein PHH98_03315 [Candidatus Gracilibacteria bacterium]|nr:hypothetical protein [Candidatus Gracilibacteria bacterium]
MFEFDFSQLKDNILSGLYEQFYSAIEIYLPKFIGALFIVGLGFICSILIYKLVIYIFKKFNIINFVDKLFINLKDIHDDDEKSPDEKVIEEKKLIRKKKISDKIKLDVITAKAFAYYIFLVFFRYAIVFIGIAEVEIFLGDLITYLPSLFIAIVIGFFGVRFANFVYDIVYHALDLTKQKTAKIIASGAKIIILFFTLMVVLSKIGIATEITNTILIGFVSMLSLAGGLAFGLGGKEIAHEILESFRK